MVKHVSKITLKIVGLVFLVLVLLISSSPYSSPLFKLMVNKSMPADENIACNMDSPTKPSGFLEAKISGPVYSWDTKYGRVYAHLQGWEFPNIPLGVTKKVTICKKDNLFIRLGTLMHAEDEVFFYNASGKFIIECDIPSIYKGNSNHPVCGYLLNLPPSDAEVFKFEL